MMLYRSMFHMKIHSDILFPKSLGVPSRASRPLSDGLNGDMFGK